MIFMARLSMLRKSRPEVIVSASAAEAGPVTSTYRSGEPLRHPKAF